MSDLYDVQNMLATLAQEALYPHGIDQPSIANCGIRIYPGWPEPNSLDADLTNDIVNVSIFPTQQITATTRFTTDWQTIFVQSPTIFMSVSDNKQVITLSGTISTPQVLMAVVNGIGFNYPVKQTDTLDSIAGVLGKIIPGATWLNNTVIIPNAYSLKCYVSTEGSAVRELAREKRLFYVVIWATTPLQRSIIGNAIAGMYASNYRILMPDGLYGQLSYHISKERDGDQKKKLYRRDIYVEFEHAISQTEMDYVIANNIVKLFKPSIEQFYLLNGNQMYLLNGNPLVLAGD